MLYFVAPNALTEEQVARVEEGFKDTQATVPFMDMSESALRSYVLDSEREPIGCLTEIPYEGGYVEIGVRFWGFTPRITLILNDWIDGLLLKYDAVIARVYRSNWPVKKLLVRGGFRMFRIEGKVEFFIVTPDTFMGERGRTHG